MSAQQVVITDSDLPTHDVEEQLLHAAGFGVIRANCRSEDDVIDAAAEAHALIVQWAPITERVLTSLERCSFISRLGIGWDMIDVRAASARGIAVANTPDYCIEEVAAHTIALALATSRGLLGLNDSIRKVEWSVSANTPTIMRPSAARFGVIGFGRIGARVADIAKALGFQVVVHDPHVADEAIVVRGFHPASLEAALSETHVVTLHMPLTEETHHFIDADALRQMNATSFLINTSRGGLVDETALADALRRDSIAGAALDVFEQEPLRVDSPLRDAPKLLLTPHAAWYSREALMELPAKAAQQVIDFFAGAPLSSIVNPAYAEAVILDGAHGHTPDRISATAIAEPGAPPA